MLKGLARFGRELRKRASQQWRNREWGTEPKIAAALFVATIIARIPFRAATFYNGDSVNFGLGLERFSISEYQPHPPGYILYIAAGRFLNFFLGDAHAALLTLSILAAAAAVALIYLIGNSIFDRATGLAAAVLLLFSPLAWFYGEVALSYEVELPLALVAVWLLYQLFFHRRYALAAAIVIGVTAGVRQDVLLFLGPFWLLGTLRLGRKEMLLSWSAMVVSVLAWAAPLVYLAGGLEAYRQISSAQFEGSVNSASIFATGASALTIHTREIWRAGLWLTGVAGWAFLYYPALLAVERHVKLNQLDRRQLFMVALTLPALTFFLVFHFGQPGYLLICAGPIMLLAANALVRISQVLPRLPSLAGNAAVTPAGATTGQATLLLAAMLIPIALINSFLFLRADRISIRMPTTGGTVASVYGLFSSGGIDTLDREKSQVLAAVRGFDPAHTVVVSAYPFNRFADDSHWLTMYLPEYRVLTLMMSGGQGYFQAENHYSKWHPGETAVSVPSGYDRAVLLGFDPVASAVKPLPTPVVPGAEDVRVSSAPIPNNGGIRLGAFTITPNSS
jgi:hypothetical protein